MTDQVKPNPTPDWVTRGKTIRQLILELQSFGDQAMEVSLSLDGGETRRPVSLVGRIEGQCVLIYAGESESA